MNMLVSNKNNKLGILSIKEDKVRKNVCIKYSKSKEQFTYSKTFDTKKIIADLETEYGICFLDKYSMILYKDNNLTDKKPYALNYLSEKFKESEYYKMLQEDKIPSLQMALTFFLCQKNGMNSTYEDSDFDKLLFFVEKTSSN